MGVINGIIDQLCEILSHDDVVYYPEASGIPLEQRGRISGTAGISGMTLGEETKSLRSAEIKAYIAILGTQDTRSSELLAEFEEVLGRLSSSGIGAAEIRQAGCAYSARIAAHELRCELILRGAFSFGAS